MQYHPHMASGLSFVGSVVSMAGAVSVRATHAVFAAGSAWSFDDAKWATSVAVSLALGGVGLYMHVVERLDKHREKRRRIETEARLEREEMEAESRRRRERADASERAWEAGLKAEVERRIRDGLPAAAVDPAAAPALPAPAST